MSKEEAIEVEGVVTKALSNAKFNVEIQNGHMVVAYPAGKMRRFFINMQLPDKDKDEIALAKLRINRKEEIGAVLSFKVSGTADDDVATIVTTEFASKLVEPIERVEIVGSTKRKLADETAVAPE